MKKGQLREEDRYLIFETNHNKREQASTLFGGEPKKIIIPALLQVNFWVGPAIEYR